MRARVAVCSQRRLSKLVSEQKTVVALKKVAYFALITLHAVSTNLFADFVVVALFQRIIRRMKVVNEQIK